MTKKKYSTLRVIINCILKKRRNSDAGRVEAMDGRFRKNAIYNHTLGARWVFIMPRCRFIFLTIAGIWFLSSLGFWQLDRADEKRSMLMHYAQLHKNLPIVLNDIDKIGASKQGIEKIEKIDKIENYQPIQAMGIYDNTHVFFLDNQFYQHQLGYEVIESFILPQTKKVLLVSLGWVKAPEDRHQLPILAPITGEQNLHGTAYFPSKSLLLLGANSDNDEINAQHWPKRIEKLDQHDIQEWLGRPVYPFILRLDAVSKEKGSVQSGVLIDRDKRNVRSVAPFVKGGSLRQQAGNFFIRDWPIVALSPERHIGYAIQWFAMAAVGLILFLVVNIKKRDNRKGNKK